MVLKKMLALALLLVLSGCETESFFNRTELLKSSDTNLQDVGSDPNVLDSGPDGNAPGPSGSSPSPAPSGSPSASPSPSQSPPSSYSPPIEPQGDETPLACGESDTRVDATYKCHVSASRPASEIHCVFKPARGQQFAGAIGVILKPAAESSGSNCSSVVSNSLLAKVPNLPANKGQYHFSGGLAACIQSYSGNPVSLRRMLSAAMLKALAQHNWVSVAGSDAAARKGNVYEALSGVSGNVVNNAYCSSK